MAGKTIVAMLLAVGAVLVLAGTKVFYERVQHIDTQLVIAAAVLAIAALVMSWMSRQESKVAPWISGSMAAVCLLLSLAA